MSNKIDYTNVDYKGFKTMMVEVLQELIPEYTDTSETDAGMVIYEAVSRALDIITYYQNVQANETFLVTAEVRNNILKWCKMLGYTPRSCTPAKYSQYFVIQSNSGEVVIPKGTPLRTKEQNLNNAIYFTTLSELRVNTSGDMASQKGFVQAGTEDGTYIFTVDIAHGTLVTGEVLGNGVKDVKNQRFTLKNTPVVLPDFDKDGFALMPQKIEGSEYLLYPDGFDEARSFVVTVGGKEWTMKSSFIDSTANSTDFTVEVAQDNKTTLVFGDGINGKIPEGEIVVSYRKGGGSGGNVGANTITILPSPISGVKSTYNPDMAYSLGADKETVAELRLNAPNSYRTKWSCVEDTDYAAKVIELFPRIMMASSFSLAENTDMDFAETIFDTTGELTDEQKNYIIDAVQVCVLLTGDIINPDGKYKKLKDFRKIEDAVDLKSEILESLSERAMLGTHQILTSFTSKMVTLKSSLIPKSGYDFEDVQTQVADFLSEYFVIGSIKSGQTVSLNELEADVYSAVEGVRAFRITSFVLADGTEDTQSLDITSNKWEIIELDDDATKSNIINPTDRG